MLAHVDHFREPDRQLVETASRQILISGDYLTDLTPGPVPGRRVDHRSAALWPAFYTKSFRQAFFDTIVW
jgi:hypothetical protein